MKPGKVIIAGGSVGGLFAGVLLAKVGWNVTIYERSSGGLSGKGAGLVPQAEVGQILDEIGRPDVMKTGVIARERIFLNHDGSIAQKLHRPQAQISWDLLFEAFRALDGDLTYHNGRSIVEVQSHEGHATVILDDGSEETADLIIGADGIGSTVREFVAPETAPRYAGYAAFRGLGPENRLPVMSAGLLFDRFTFYDAPGQQFLGYLVAGPDGSIVPCQRRYNWVWYRTLTPSQFAEALKSDRGDRRTYSAPPGGLSVVTREDLITSASLSLPEVLAEVVMQEQLPFVQGIFDYEAPTLVSGRVVLLGDAAFVVRPHTAMGVAKAAGDAMTLRDWLGAASNLKEALHRYNEDRLAVGRSIAGYGRKLGANLTNG